MEEFIIPEDAKKILNDPEMIKKQIKEGLTFQEIIGYSEETMEKFYGAAYNLFQRKNYRDSANAFVFLTTLNPYVHNYWLGLGMSEQLNEEFEAALLAYAMAILTKIDNPIPHYHSARCYKAMNDYKNARASVDLAIQYSLDRDEFLTLLSHAQVLRNSLSE